MMRRTKIVCTIGPSSATSTVLDRLVAAGMDVARLNFSHGDHAWHAEVIQCIREGRGRWGKGVAILQDLQGPKIRLDRFEGGRAQLDTGATFTLTSRPVLGTASDATISAPELLSELKPGDQVWMDDGLVQLRVEAVEGGDVRCRVTAGGVVGDHKGVVLPRGTPPVSCLTAKDREDLKFGLAHGVDYVAVSFVRSATDIQEVRKVLHEQGAEVPVIAKIERGEAVTNLPGILALVDGVMVARGDLGMEVPLEEVPLIQKEVIRQARLAKVPVIVATQMLESMVEHLRPTRAEVSDVATAIFERADAIMLSAETATGKHPVETVEVMARIAERTERSITRPHAERRRQDVVGFPQAIADAACHAARDLKAKAIVAFTQSGSTARLISQERPEVPIIALTPFPEVQRRLALCWGVSSRLIRKVETTDEMVEEVEATLLGDGSVRPDDVLVIISGAPMWVTGTTNLLKLHRVGERR
ncbi:MAG: pyruvate kinase [Candidatus Rokubacteria bacterium]|nr:pyruvate kinase [Candidatus Rokubacteria bacterium]